MIKCDVKFQKYKYKKTDMIVKAVKFEMGMEDGWKKGNPYIIVWDNGFQKKENVTEKHYIVLHKNFKFIFHQKVFSNLYRRVKNDE